MSTRTRTLLAQIGSFLLAGILLYAALRGVDFGSVVQALQEADYRWLLPLIAIALSSHVLRAWRWQMLLEALPPVPPEAETKKVSLTNAFAALVIGYMVNYAAPRLGEVARSANLAARERLPFSGVLGTVVVERILDVIVLVLALLSVGVLLLDQAADLHALFIEPLAAWPDWFPLPALLGLLLAVGLLVLMLYRRALANAKLQHLWTQRLQPVLVSFKAGLFTLWRIRQPGALLFSTLAMWFCYLLMAYLPFVMLGMSTAYGLTLLDAWSIMILGTIGVVIPSPGGTGSYHFITIQTLVHLFGVDQDPAATYAVLTHAAQLVLYVLAGAVCLLLQGSSLRSLRTETQQGPQQSDTEPAPQKPYALEKHPHEPS